ncbi:protein translocase subunit SecF [Candidatus Peregrinibacteria bacterium]|jgi:SecD/SecF fusion protein|nr:protein translocase subunit SecF [Candidatus Peregrinibacteria bacterium]
MNKRTITHLTLIALAIITLGFFNLPYNTQTNILSSTPDSFETQKIQLGLDLQGGTQLDYKVDLRKVEDRDQEAIIEGVLEVLTRRVNGLGVSEPNIYRSEIADEQHIIIELAGIKDIDEAKAIVGKTIQLEFKEEGGTAITTENRAQVEVSAQSALDRILAGEDFMAIASEEELANPGVAFYFPSDEEGHVLESYLADGYAEALATMEVGETHSELLQTSDGYTFDTYGNLTELEGYFIIRLIDARDGEKITGEDKEVEARHVLVAAEDRELAEELLERAQNGESVEDLAKEYSTEPGANSSGGYLGFFGPGAMVKPFEDAAFAMGVGDVSANLVETEFGLHIIEVIDIKEATSETVIETEYKLEKLFYSTAPDPWRDTNLTGEHFTHADVAFSQTYTPYVTIEFNSEGSKLFEEITEKNVGKRVAIFVGGELISAPNVNEKITGGRAQISGDFTVEEASELARDLNTGAIPAPIILVGQYTIGASLGQSALDTSLKAGLIGLIILVLYMMLYYRLPGLLANIALSLYAILLIFCIKVAMPLVLSLTISLIVFSTLVVLIMRNKDSGWEKLLSFMLACFVLFFLTYLLSSAVVLTLAGVAGVVLSIGMAVDANILIFERMREELHNGRPLSGAIEVGFDRAWSSIRDSNFSSLITCAILIYFGTSIIRGFAVNLALGILISMFTAIIITRTLLRALVKTKLGKSDFLLGTPKKSHPRLPIIKARKIWFGLSGALIIASLIAIPLNGLNFGLDFTGGTLLEIQFNETVPTSDEVSTKITEIEENLLVVEDTVSTVTEELEEEVSTIEDAPQAILMEESSLIALEEDQEIPVDFGEPVIVSTSETSYMIRMKHISNESHEAIIATFTDSFGEVEETRFNTIGPTIGATMKTKAVMALGLALIMIVFYIAFAFRSIPKHTSPWRFGLTAIAALVHDVLITLGVFVVLGSVLGVEIDALFVTALLTIMGFSVHDTIVTFDRVRENLKNQKAGEDFEDVAERAVNETLARSFNTSISTLFTIAALFFLGAASIHYFLLALIVGLIAGTYSSIFTATPLLVAWHKRAHNKKK